MEIKGQTVHNVIMPEGCSVHVYDYNRRWSDAVTEPDDDGKMCKQTIYLRGDGNKQTPYHFRVFVHAGEVKRLVLPHGGCEVLVKSYPDKDGAKPKEQKWVRKKT